MVIMKELKSKNMLKIHFIGICGIGMSGLAQMFSWLGHTVSGSDRAIDNSENKELISKLKKQNIDVFPQNGSFMQSKLQPDFIVYSTAIEDDNPDFKVSKHITKWHRSEALAWIEKKLSSKTSVAVTGSCGKTTVTAMIGEILTVLNEDPIVLNGGKINNFSNELYYGNFKPGCGNYFIYEADESDKSLRIFKPDVSVITNIGTDHYSKEELIDVFNVFLNNTKKQSIINSEIADLMKTEDGKIKITSVSITPKNKSIKKNDHNYILNNYKITKNRPWATVDIQNNKIDFELPTFGKFNAENSLFAIAAVQELLNEKSIKEIITALSQFKGTHRRLEYKGKTKTDTMVFDDYAHNVEKIISSITALHEITDNKIITIFQPHGFGPLNFMKDKLFEELENILDHKDLFVMMPVYYAGGTTSFQPTSKEVIESYKLKSKIPESYAAYDSRDEAKEKILNMSKENDIIVFMGARDGSLSIWASEFVDF